MNNLLKSFREFCRGERDIDLRTHPLTDPPDRDLDPPEPSDEELRREKLRREWEGMQEEKEDSDA